MIVDCAVYEQGRRVASQPTVDGIGARRNGSDGFVWVGLFEPTGEEFEAVRREFHLHELAVEDALKAHQRPKLDVYGDTLFLVLKTAHLASPEGELEIGEVMLFAGPDFLISVRHGEGGGLGDVRERLETHPELLAKGPRAALHALVDRIVDGYQPVADTILHGLDAVEADVFSQERSNPVERIYKLRREVLRFHRAILPLLPAINRLAHDELPGDGGEFRPYFKDVADHLARIVDQVEGFRDLLASILQANLTQVGVRQNDDMRRISAWVAILAVPTAIAGIYGMNFEHMPELRWTFGYPLVLGIILLSCLVLHRRFRRAGWL